MYRTLTPSTQDSGSDRCSAATAASTSPSSTSSTPEQYGSPNSTSPSPGSSPTTDPTHRTSVTSRPSTGAKLPQLEPSRPSRRPDQRLPLPGRVHRRQARRPLPRHPLRAVGTHGAAIYALQPEWNVIENVRGLLSSPATRPTAEGNDHQQRNPGDATLDGATLRGVEPDPWHLGDHATRPLRALGTVLGDLADARWIGLPASLVGAPHHRLRIFILAQRTLPHPTRDRLHTWRRDPRPSTGKARDDRALTPDHRPRPPRIGCLAEQESRVGDPVVTDRRALLRWGRYADAITRWKHITGRPAPAPALLNDVDGSHPAPAFVEWLMGRPAGSPMPVT